MSELKPNNETNPASGFLMQSGLLDDASQHKPFAFFSLSGDIRLLDDLRTRLQALADTGFGGVILLPREDTLPEYLSDDYQTALAGVAALCREIGLETVISIDCATSPSCPSGYAFHHFREKYPDDCSQRLDREEYSCDEHEHVKRPIKQDGTLMSVVAGEVDTGETLYLMPYCHDGVLEYDMPDGNWTIHFFYCRKSKDAEHVNFLSYDSSFRYLEMVCSGLMPIQRQLGDEKSLLCVFDCLQFLTVNRRDWDPNFNTLFRDEYGFDPAPYYLSMFLDTGDTPAYFRAILLHARAEMVRKGFLRAFSDYTHSRLMRSTTSVAVPKAVSAPWIFGDGLRFQERSDICYAKITHSYLYGLNGVKLASSAAANYGKREVLCDMFRRYDNPDPSVIMRETMNVLARGATSLWLREEVSANPLYSDILPSYCRAVADSCSLLSKGRHVSDIAVLYPINSLESQTFLFEHHATSGDYEYPVTPANADFMNLINVLMNYSGHDVTLLHPVTLNGNCFVEGNRLCLTAGHATERYQLLILPGSSLFSLHNMRTVKKFFDGGGKVIATSCLPFTAREQYRDHGASAELNELIHHIFGIEKESNTLTDYTVNRNENGGVAYFLHASATAADGSDMIDPIMLQAALNDMDLSFDVQIHDMPRFEDHGVMNLYYPIYSRFTTENGDLPGGLFNYIHRSTTSHDIYFFSNTTTRSYNGTVSLRGCMKALFSYNPETGAEESLPLTYEKDGGEVHTIFTLSLPTCACLFVIGTHDSENIGTPLLSGFPSPQKTDKGMVSPMKTIVMAAGKGTRLASLGSTPMPKVLRPANGRPLLDYVLAASSGTAVEDTVIVVGYLAEQVISAYPDYRCVRQGDDAYGTGYAVKCGLTDSSFDDYHGDIMIVNGDMPLFRFSTFEAMKEAHKASGAVCTMLTCDTEEPLPYGRIVRDENGRITEIVEEADCTPEQKKITELNVGMYIFNADRLRYALSLLKNDNAKGEYYITDLPHILIEAGDQVESFVIHDEEEIRGVNTPDDLAAVGETLRLREEREKKN